MTMIRRAGAIALVQRAGDLFARQRWQLLPGAGMA
jgi:hypothetical protein